MLFLFAYDIIEHKIQWEAFMNYFFFILIHNILPVFFVIGLGYTIHKKFQLDIRSLSKVTFYAFVPALIFVKIYETNIHLDLLKAIGFTAVFLLVQGLSTHVITRQLKYQPALKKRCKKQCYVLQLGELRTTSN